MHTLWVIYKSTSGYYVFYYSIRTNKQLIDLLPSAHRRCFFFFFRVIWFLVFVSFSLCKERNTKTDKIAKFIGLCSKHAERACAIANIWVLEMPQQKTRSAWISIAHRWLVGSNELIFVVFVAIVTVAVFIFAALLFLLHRIIFYAQNYNYFFANFGNATKKWLLIETQWQKYDDWFAHLEYGHISESFIQRDSFTEFIQ